MNRREFIKLSLASGAMGWLNPQAIAASNKVLRVFVFLRGGMDALNFIGPLRDDIYLETRPEGLRVTVDDLELGNTKLGFRLTRNASKIHELFLEKYASFWLAIGLTQDTRSHFVAQDLMEQSFTTSNKGWLADTGGLGLDIGEQASLSYQGKSQIGVTPDLTQGFRVPGQQRTMEFVDKFLSGSTSPYSKAMAQASSIWKTFDQTVSRDTQGKILPYESKQAANYGTTQFDKGLKSIAQACKANIGLTSATISLGGWDTHENQLGRFPNLVRQLDQGLHAFFKDLHPEYLVDIVVISEFGRRFRVNTSQGTDHGHGGAAIRITNREAGGMLRGIWPGLANEHLSRGVDLAVTTDYKQLFWEVLQ